MYSFKPDRTLAVGCALLVQAITAIPALAVEPAPLDDAVLRQSTAPTTHDDKDPDQNALQSEQPGKAGDRKVRQGEVSQIVRTTNADLKTAAPAPALRLSPPPAFSGLQDPGTNFVFSANKTSVSTVGP